MNIEATQGDPHFLRVTFFGARKSQRSLQATFLSQSMDFLFNPAGRPDDNRVRMMRAPAWDRAAVTADHPARSEKSRHKDFISCNSMDLVGIIGIKVLYDAHSDVKHAAPLAMSSQNGVQHEEPSYETKKEFGSGFNPGLPV